MDLFDYKVKDKLKQEAPLADRIRPATLDEFVGQQAVVGEGSVLRGLIAADDVPSVVLWGPPGTGKTTLARIIAKLTASRFVQLSAVASGVAELRAVVLEAQEFRKLEGTRTIIFVDEIHRWNKAQQDAFLPYVEDGTVTLIGATTENPSFEVNAALLSRCKVFTLTKLDAADIAGLLERALADKENGFPDTDVTVEDGVIGFLAQVADGDARSALGALELAVKSSPATVQKPVKGRVDQGGRKMVRLQLETVAKTLARSHVLYDKGGEEHYNIISALHKSMRGNNANAALYWLGRMLEAGDDPLYVARRLVRFASEDIGLADPQALVQAAAAFQATHQLGMPECNVILAQAVAYLAKAPKSNALYTAYQAVQKDIREQPNDPVPLHLRNAPTKLMKTLGYGKGYVYTPDAPDAPQDFLPERLRKRNYLDE
jgi:putative ATPase